MSYYITHEEFQNHMKSYYERTGNKMQFPEMCKYLFKKGFVHSTLPFPKPNNNYENMTDEEFDKFVDSIPFSISPYLNTSITSQVQETAIIPEKRDIIVIRHPRYTRELCHIHNYFEVNFVIKGSARFIFGNETHTMQKGEICIIAPSSRHDLQIEGDTIVFTVCIRQSTFNTTFFSLMSGNNLLSYFFRTTLRGNDRPNYLLFFTKENHLLKCLIRRMMIESNQHDTYGNTCCINYANLFFATILRNYSETIQFYDYQMSTDFSLVLQYIQHNYLTLTLTSLAELFHYSKSHLCSKIKQNTGYTFTELITSLRMSEAVNYLVNTELKISEIAEQVGYNSADHFSRIFRSIYNVSPREYRRQNLNTDTELIPFAT